MGVLEPSSAFLFAKGGGGIIGLILTIIVIIGMWKVFVKAEKRERLCPFELRFKGVGASGILDDNRFVLCRRGFVVLL